MPSATSLSRVCTDETLLGQVSASMMALQHNWKQLATINKPAQPLSQGPQPFPWAWPGYNRPISNLAPANQAMCVTAAVMPAECTAHSHMVASRAGSWQQRCCHGITDEGFMEIIRLCVITSMQPLFPPSHHYPCQRVTRRAGDALRAIARQGLAQCARHMARSPASQLPLP